MHACTLALPRVEDSSKQTLVHLSPCSEAENLRVEVFLIDWILTDLCRENLGSGRLDIILVAAYFEYTLPLVLKEEYLLF